MEPDNTCWIRNRKLSKEKLHQGFTVYHAPFWTKYRSSWTLNWGLYVAIRFLSLYSYGVNSTNTNTPIKYPNILRMSHYLLLFNMRILGSRNFQSSYNIRQWMVYWPPSVTQIDVILDSPFIGNWTAVPFVFHLGRKQQLDDKTIRASRAEKLRYIQSNLTPFIHILRHYFKGSNTRMIMLPPRHVADHAWLSCTLWREVAGIRPWRWSELHGHIDALLERS
jgi:hypothetical protein